MRNQTLIMATHAVVLVLLHAQQDHLVLSCPPLIITIYHDAYTP